VFWDCLYFHWMSFFLSQRTKVAIMHLFLGFGLLGITTFVEYGASVPSDFDDGNQCFGEISLYYFFRVTWAPPR
jgi:hypothetical protein